MGTISSTSFDSRAGSGTIDITHASLTGGTTFEVSSIGTIEADFDLEEESENAQSVYFKLGEFNFSAFDTLSDGSSLFEQLDALSVTDEVDLDLNFTTNGGRSINDSYVFTIEEMEYSRERRETSIKGAKQVTDGIQKDLATFFNNDMAAGDIRTFTGVAGGVDSTHTRAFILTALSLFNSSNTDFIASSTFDVTIPGGGNTYIVVKDSAVDVDETMFEMAAAEGAVVGSIMGYNFFVTRPFSSSSANLSEDDGKLLNIKAGIDAYVGIDVNFVGTSTQWTNFESHSRITTLAEDLNETETDVDVTNGVPISAGDVILVNQEIMYVESVSTNTLTVIRGYKSEATTHSNGDNVADTFNPNAQKILSVLFENRAMAWADYDNTNDEFDNIGGTVDAAANSGYTAYASAYGANKARKIKLVVFGIDTVKPYQSITLDSSFPSLVQNQTFRPSALTYDLDNDIIEIEVYKIA